MARAWILTAAMPPTRGHANIIEFATQLPVELVKVLQVSRTGEPMRAERLEALREYFETNPRIAVEGLYIDSPGPETDDYWVEVLKNWGFQLGDYLVASERWGQYIASEAGGKFIPYDYQREIHYTRATEVRNDLSGEWRQILPTFQKLLQRRVVIFGAESVGKTTLTKDLANSMENSIETIEFARPYLETVGEELTVSKMSTIVEGQEALQKSLNSLSPVPQTIIMDTDLYSTLGYWKFWNRKTVPSNLERRAHSLRGNLYLLVPANIPFEKDDLRYGGSSREKPDSYWEEVLKTHSLPYKILKSRSREGRIKEAKALIEETLGKDLRFQRMDNVAPLS